MHAHRAQGVGQGGRPDEIECGVDTVREEFAYGGRDLAGVEQGVVDAAVRQEGEAAGPARGGQHRGAAPGGQRGGGQAHRGGAAADQDGLTWLQVQARGQGAVGGLHHLRQRAQHLPGQLGVDRDDLRQRHRRVLGVAAVVGAAHVPHHRDDLLTGGEPAAGGRRVDGSGGLDARHPGEGDALAHPQPQLQLRAVDAERLDADAHPAVPDGRERERGRPQVVHRARAGEADRPHGGR